MTKTILTAKEKETSPSAGGISERPLSAGGQQAVLSREEQASEVEPEEPAPPVVDTWAQSEQLRCCMQVLA